jgi:hypothetical protein
MVEDRLLLCEDADDELERVIAAGLARGVPPPPAGQPPTPGLCPSRLW